MHKVIGLTITLLYSGTALADMVWLKNGDIISGKIKLKDGNKLFVNTEYAGTIAIDNDKMDVFNYLMSAKKGHYIEPVSKP